MVFVDRHYKANNNAPVREVDTAGTFEDSKASQHPVSQDAYQVKNTFLEFGALEQGQRRRASSDFAPAGSPLRHSAKSPLVVAKSPTCSPTLQPVDETRQALPIDEVDFELLPEDALGDFGESVPSTGPRERASSQDGTIAAIAQRPAGVGGEDPAYIVPTTPSPFLQSSFPPSMLPPFGGCGYGLTDAMLPPAFDVNGQPLPMGDGMAFMPPEMFDPSLGYMYGWGAMAMDANGYGFEGIEPVDAVDPGQGLPVPDDCGGPAPASQEPICRCGAQPEHEQEGLLEADAGEAALSPTNVKDAEVATLDQGRKESRRSKRNCGDERNDTGGGGGAARGFDSRGTDSRGEIPPWRQEETRGSKATSVPKEKSDWQQWEGAEEYTTVMLRNIPNKYTREMLIKQLNQDYGGQFDFMYLPIDFKNKCNVGYGFINFRTQDICERFVSKFHGVDVRKCLPGLNSKKIVEVTPARVQGKDENVRRLRNSPVMNQLMEHPEWMPLVFNQYGESEPFPTPDQMVLPVKPRKNRDHARNIDYP